MKQIRLLLMTLLALLSASPVLANKMLYTDGQGVTYELFSNGDATVLDGESQESDVFPAHEGLTGDIVIPESFTLDGKTYTVTTIGQGTFMLNTGITSITIPRTITYISRSAFAYCSGVTDVYCYANPNYLTWFNPDSDYSMEFKENKATIFHVPANFETKYKSKFSKINATIVGDLPNLDGSTGLTSTFSSWDGSDSPLVNGTMRTLEGNDWYMSIPRGGLEVSYTKVGTSAEDAETCIFIKNSSSSTVNAEINSTFPITGLVKKIVVRVNGNVYSINAVVRQQGSDSKTQQQTINPRMSGSAFTDVELSFDSSIEYKDGSVKLTITGTSSLAIHGISIVQDDDPTSGTWENLKWRVENVGTTDDNKTLYRLVISGDGSMPGYSEAKPWSAFADNIIYVMVEAGVTNVTYGAFNRLPILYEMFFPSTVKSIDGRIIDNFSPVNFIKFSEGLESIGEYAFPWCSYLQELNLPASLTEIYPTSFKGNGIRKLTVASGNPKFDSRNDCNAVILKEKNMLLFGTPKTVVPATVTSIGENAFDNMNMLVNFVIPDNVTTIGKAAFNACNGLKSLSIGSGVTTIGENAFQNSTKMEDVYCTADPAKLTWEGYDNVKNFKEGKGTIFHVPSGTKSAWQTKFPSLNATIVDDLEATPVGDGDVSGDGKTDDKDVTALMSYLMGSAPEGFTPEAADVNGDHKVDVADIVALINIIKKSK